MAILQISRIQSRRGLQENLPQPLAAAEIGWAMDSRRLFIGNGATDEGAPQIGNTEILTEWSNIFDIATAYTFSGLEAGGRIVVTGPSVVSPASRSMQNKFDDIVNFRDFGGKGDGVTNDVKAFNRAITELFNIVAVTEDNKPKVRRTLHIPAGVYVLSTDGLAVGDLAFINMLPYVKLKGDGKNSTFIIQTSSNPVISAASASWLEVEGITLANATDNDVTRFNISSDVLFNNVRMQKIVWSSGMPITIDTLSTPTGVGSYTACVKLDSSSKLTFTNCDFIGTTYAFLATNTGITNVNVIGGLFLMLWLGLELGDTNGGYAPAAFRVTHSHFDQVALDGIRTTTSGTQPDGSFGSVNVVSAFNTFKDVGNKYPLSKNPVISFGGKNSYSIGDTFQDRTVSETPVVALNGKASFATLPNGKLQLGTQVTANGTDITFDNHTTGNAVIGIGFASTLLEYSVFNNISNKRTGTLKITTDGVGVTYEDDYVETAETGISLVPTISGNTIVLNYTLESSVPTVANATLKTTTRTFI